MTTRSLLQPYYVVVDRRQKPKTFIQASPEEYNDILNNYRIVLGEYQFRRSLFAKKYLYPEEWDDMFSFAFSREPTERCISMFHFLFWNNRDNLEKISRYLIGSIKCSRLLLSTSYAFDVFLDLAHKARFSDSVYRPLGKLFTTHTAPMWDDVTDADGRILLKQIYRLDSLTEGINSAFEECGIPKRIGHDVRRRNQSSCGIKYCPNRQQVNKIREIYDKDFELYENAWHTIRRT